MDCRRYRIGTLKTDNSSSTTLGGKINTNTVKSSKRLSFKNNIILQKPSGIAVLSSKTIKTRSVMLKAPLETIKTTESLILKSIPRNILLSSTQNNTKRTICTSISDSFESTFNAKIQHKRSKSYKRSAYLHKSAANPVKQERKTKLTLSNNLKNQSRASLNLILAIKSTNSSKNI